MSVFLSDVLKDQVAFVTGGATGIGFQIAKTLGEHGARVFIASRKDDALFLACKELGQAKVISDYAVCDIRDPLAVESAVDQCLERYGRLDILVNNAAGNFPAPITDISYNGFKTIVDIDLLGTYNVTKAVFEKSMRNNGGNIVNISAPFQHCGAAYQAHVAAAKSGVDSLTRSCAVEFAKHGVRVNAVAPGATGATEGLDRFSEQVPGSTVTNPLGVIGSKADIANAVLFLLTDAAGYITGQIIAVDGGASVDLLKLPL